MSNHKAILPEEISLKSEGERWGVVIAILRDISQNMNDMRGEITALVSDVKETGREYNRMQVENAQIRATAELLQARLVVIEKTIDEAAVTVRNLKWMLSVGGISSAAALFKAWGKL